MKPLQTTSLIYLFFAMIALFLQYYILRYDTNGTHIILSGDGGNIASFLSGWLYPERFTDDLVLHTKENFAFYISASLPFTAFFHLIFDFDIGTAFSFAYAPLIFLQLVGFYLLGNKLFNNQGVAFSLALLSMASSYIGAGEHWAILHEPISRQWHNALLPFFLMALISWYDKPAKWWWLFAICGGAVYLHPVGAPALAVMAGFTILTTKPDAFTWYKHIWKLALGCTGFFIVAAPFIALYLYSFPALEEATSGSDIATHIYKDMNLANVDAIIALKQVFIPTYTLTLEDSFLPTLYRENILEPRKLSHYIKNNWNIICLVFGLLGYYLAYKRDKNPHIILFTKVMIGIFIVAIILPLIDQTIGKLNNSNPVQYDLARNIRFIVPLFYIGLIYFGLSQKTHLKRYTTLTFITLIGLVFFSPVMARFAYKEFRKDYVPRIFEAHADVAPHFAYLDEIKEPQKILPIGPSSKMQRLSLAIRYNLRHAVVYTSKDRNALGYSNSPDYWRWLSLKEHYDIIMNQEESKEAKHKALKTLLAKTKTDYLLINHTFGNLDKLTKTYGDTVVTSEYFTLIKVSN